MQCKFFLLLITLHIFIKTTTDYNLTVCVKKETATKLQTHIGDAFLTNCTFIVLPNDYLDNSFASISPVTRKIKK